MGLEIKCDVKWLLCYVIIPALAGYDGYGKRNGKKGVRFTIRTAWLAWLLAK
jgi:hypothetical protein